MNRVASCQSLRFIGRRWRVLGWQRVDEAGGAGHGIVPGQLENQFSIEAGDGCFVKFDFGNRPLPSGFVGRMCKVLDLGLVILDHQTEKSSLLGADESVAAG